MILERLSIINYKNIQEATLELSPNINCFIGHNGAGKTNVLDAVYFLSFCHSAQTTQDSLVIRHDQDFFMMEGTYEDFTIHCGMKRGAKKVVRRDKKAYQRLSEHIGLIPIVMVSPTDIQLIEGSSEERRRLMDIVISQLDRSYIDSLNRYNKALQQRNAMLKMEDREPDPEILSLWEEQMAREGEVIYQKRQFSPVGSGRLATRLSLGATESCYRAADEAMAGVQPVGNCLFFRTVIPQIKGTIIGGHVFY